MSRKKKGKWCGPVICANNIPMSILRAITLDKRSSRQTEKSLITSLTVLEDPSHRLRQWQETYGRSWTCAPLYSGTMIKCAHMADDKAECWRWWWWIILQLFCTKNNVAINVLGNEFPITFYWKWFSNKIPFRTLFFPLNFIGYCFPMIFYRKWFSNKCYWK